MALINCWECKSVISDSAAVCPKCGAANGPAKVTVARDPDKKSVWPWIVGVPVGLFVAFVLYGLSIPKYQSEAREKRNICEKIAAAYERSQCARNYVQDLERGRALAEAAKSR